MRKLAEWLVDVYFRHFVRLVPDGDARFTPFAVSLLGAGWIVAWYLLLWAAEVQMGR